MAKLLVTGGSGDLGRAVSQRAVAAGHDVAATYLTRPTHIVAGKPIRLDLGDEAAVQHTLTDVEPDVIIHTAVTQGIPDPRPPNIDAARNLAQLRYPLTWLITLSSDMIFDGLKAPYREDDPPSPVSLYGEAKAQVESFGDLVVRTSLIYDFERGNKQVDWLLDQIANGKKVRLFSDEFRSPIWTENLADALLELAERRITGILNVAGPESMSRLDLGRGMLNALGYDPDNYVEVVSQAGTGRPPDLTLDVSKAQRLLETRLLTFQQARARWQAEKQDLS